MRKLVIGLMFCAIIAIGGMEFDGNTSYVDVTPMSVLEQGAQTFSITGWLKSNDVTEYQRVFWKGTGVNIVMVQFYTSRLIFYISNSSTYQSGYFILTGVLENNTLYHFACVFDGTLSGNANRCKIYINGEQKTLTFAGTIPSSSNAPVGSPAHIGHSDNSFNGELPNVIIWDKALTATEVQELYDSYGNGWPNDGTNTIPPTADWIGARGYSDGATITNGNATVYDISGNALHGTATNGVKQATVSVPLTYDVVTDYSGNGGDAVVYGDPILSQTSDFFWYAYDGVGDRLDLFAGTNVFSGASKFTMSAYSRRQAVTYMYLAANTIGGGGFGMELYPATAYLDIKTGIHVDFSAVVDGEWHRRTMVYDGTLTGNTERVKYYIDGTQQVSTADTGTVPNVLPNQSSPLRLNYRSWSAAYGVSDVGRVLIWKDALSSNAVLNIESNIIPQTGLIGDYTMTPYAKPLPIPKPRTRR